MVMRQEEVMMKEARKKETVRRKETVLDEYVKYGFHDFDLETQKNAEVPSEEVGSLTKNWTWSQPD